MLLADLPSWGRQPRGACLPIACRPDLRTHHCVHGDTMPLGASANDNMLGRGAGPLPPNVQLLPVALPCSSPIAWPGLPQPSSWLPDPSQKCQIWAPHSHHLLMLPLLFILCRKSFPTTILLHLKLHLGVCFTENPSDKSARDDWLE